MIERQLRIGWVGNGPRRRSRGVALLAVIWVVTLLSAIAAGMVSTTRTESVITRNRVENARAEALADAAFNRTLLTLMHSLAGDGPAIVDPPSVVASPELGRLAGRLQGAGPPLSGAERIRLDGTAYVWPFAEGVALVSVTSESGKIDLNAADAALLASLIRSAGSIGQGAEALADAIIDFRDADSDRSPKGAEDADYRALGLAHEAKDRPFESADEILQVAGMTRALYDDIAPALTVYSGDAGINPAFAPARALRAVPDLGAADAARIVAQRATSNSQDAVNSLGQNPYLSAASTPIFTIRAEAHLATRTKWGQHKMGAQNGDRAQNGDSI